MLEGSVFKFGDNISTDLIIPGRYFHLRSNLPELAKHVLEDADPSFAKNVKVGDFVVAGKNFGLGSSREFAPLLIKTVGVGAIIAKSFARIFFRNSINIGLTLITCDTDSINERDIIEIDLSKGMINNSTSNSTISFPSLPLFLMNILDDGGLIECVKKNNGFVLFQ